MAWCRPGDYPLSKPMMLSSLINELKPLDYVRPLACMLVIMELDFFLVICSTRCWFRMTPRCSWSDFLNSRDDPLKLSWNFRINLHKSLCTSEHYSIGSCLGLIMYRVMTDSGCFDVAFSIPSTHYWISCRWKPQTENSKNKRLPFRTDYCRYSGGGLHLW